MKELIISVSNQMKDLKDDIAKLKKLMVPLNRRDDSLILKSLVKLVSKYPANPVIILELILFLMVCNNETLVDQYGFSDIKKLLTKSCGLFEKDIDLNMEKYYFTKNIEMDEEKASAFIVKFQAKINKEISF